MSGTHSPHRSDHRCARTPLGARGHAVRIGIAVGATAVVAGLLPWNSAAADDPEEPGFAGYSTAAVASPLRIEIYEPTIPIPAVPQVELSLGYSSVKADVSSTRSRASYLWPGGTVGEGFSTLAEQLGLPPQLGEAGYPVQVNAASPGGPEEERDEPFPGTVQRADAAPGKASARTGYSTDGEVKDDDGDSDAGGDSPLPLPELPGLPGLGENLLGDLGAALTGGQTGAAADEAGAPLLPPELAALVDLGGFSSVSKTDNGDVAFAQARANLGDVSILGGLITIEGVKTLAKAKSNGAAGDPQGEAVYGDIVAFGQRFRYGDDGYEAVGQKGTIPGLPDDAIKAMEQLGLSISVPKPTTEREEDAATSTVSGIVIDFDLTVLRTQIKPVVDVLNDLLGQLPAELGQLKSLLQAAANLSPRIVFTLGTAYASVDTSQPIEVPPVETPTETPTTEKPTDGPAPVDNAPGPGTTPPGTDTPPASDPGPTETTSPVIRPASAQPGLPKLFSIPGMLLIGGFLLAALLGTYVRRLGLAALGGMGTCPHGLDSGLPDLRKVK